MAYKGGTKIVSVPPKGQLFGFNSGTLGAWVKDAATSKLVLLTNGHVLPRAGLPVHYQTAQGAKIGECLRTGYDNVIDAAIGLPDDETSATKETGEVVYKGFADPAEGEKIICYGAVSGKGEGTIKLGVDKIRYGSRCFEIVTDWGAHGDSGTVILNANLDIVGLYWGLAMNRRYAHYITDVRDRMNIGPI